MNTIKTLKAKAWIFFVIIAASTFLYSCKKEAATGVLKTSDQQKLRDWYTANASQNKQNPFSTLSPNWDQIQVIEVGGKIVYEITMNNPQKIFIGTENLDKNQLAETFARNEIRFLIFENKTGQLENGCYMSVVNTGSQMSLASLHYKEPENLTGNIIYFNQDGKMTNGWTYRDGKVLKRISASNELEYRSMMRIKSEEARIIKTGGKLAYKPVAYCTPEYRLIYGMACAGVDGFMNCQQYVVGREYVNNCEYGGGGDEGGYTPPAPTGGGTSSGSTTREIITDSIKKKFPCADKLVLQPIFSSQPMSEFVAPFLTNLKPSITFKVVNNLPWGTATTGGYFKLGEAGQDPNSITGASAIVNLSQQMLENSSPLMIAVATVHETIHGYINYSIVNSTSSQVIGTYRDYGSWATALNSYYMLKSLPSNYADHTMMLTAHFDKAIQVLENWDMKQTRRHSTKELAMAMVYGLNTVEPNTPQQQLDIINKAYNLILDKYDIGDAELNTFNLTELISINKMKATDCQ